MNKLFFTLITILFQAQLLIAQPLIDRAGKASFYSEAPLEDIEAVNETLLGAIDLDKGTLAVSMSIKGFHFDNSLMEEHFNENYLESDKYPKAQFSGKIKDFSNLDFSKAGSFEAVVEGLIEIHGVKKTLKTIVRFESSADRLLANTQFDIVVDDFDVDIPKLVIKNIAEVVEVKASFNFKKD